MLSFKFKRSAHRIFSSQSLQKVPTVAMFSGLPSASFRISDLLTRSLRFCVPSYQRSYSWTVKEGGQLLEDVATAAGIDDKEACEPDYFLGAILLLAADGEALPRPGEEAASSRAYEIVDGQQRLVTLTILVAVLRELESDTGHPTWWQLDALLALDAGEADPERRVSGFRLELRPREQAFLVRFVQQRGGCALEPEEDSLCVGEANILAVRNHFIAELSGMEPQDRRRLAEYLCSQCYFVVLLTHDIDRAHRMFTVLNERGKPLQRNDILKAEVIRALPQDKAASVARQWDEVSLRLGADFEQLFSHVRSIHGRLKPQVIAAVRSIMEEAGGPETFVEQDLVPLGEAYYRILNASDTQVPLDPEVRRYLLYLNRLNGEDWVPAAMLALRLHETDPIGARYLLGEIDRLAHLLRILCLGNGRRVRRFGAVVEAIKSGAALKPDAPVFRLTREEMRSLLHNLKNLHGRNAQVCKLILLRLNDGLLDRTTVLDPAVFTVEHVLPQRPSATSEWRRLFPDGEEREACTECLGNLVLVTQKQNDRARNQELAAKQAIYGAVEDGSTVLEITREALEARAWTPAEVRAREARLLEFLTAMWRFGTADRPALAPAQPSIETRGKTAAWARSRAELGLAPTR